MAVKENDFIDILKLIAPGTAIREGLDNILKAKTGALIVIGENKEVMDLVDGGFNIKFRFKENISGKCTISSISKYTNIRNRNKT